MIDRATLLRQVPASVDIAALVSLTEDRPGAVDAVEEVAAGYGVDAVLRPSEFVDTRSELLNGFQRVIQWMLLFTLLQALVGVVNTLLLSVGERRREFGLLRVTGASRRQLMRLVLIEGLSFAAVGTALGLAVGVGGAILAVRSLGQYGISTIEVPLGVLLVTAVAAMALGVAAAVAPARWASLRFPRSRRSPTPAGTGVRDAVIGVPPPASSAARSLPRAPVASPPACRPRSLVRRRRRPAPPVPPPFPRSPPSVRHSVAPLRPATPAERRRHRSGAPPAPTRLRRPADVAGARRGDGSSTAEAPAGRTAVHSTAGSPRRCPRSFVPRRRSSARPGAGSCRPRPRPRRSLPGPGPALQLGASSGRAADGWVRPGARPVAERGRIAPRSRCSGVVRLRQEDAASSRRATGVAPLDEAVHIRLGAAEDRLDPLTVREAGAVLTPFARELEPDEHIEHLAQGWSKGLMCLVARTDRRVVVVVDRFPEPLVESLHRVRTPSPSTARPAPTGCRWRSSTAADCSS